MKLKLARLDVASTREDYDRVMGINLRGIWSCMKFELQQMREQGSGSIVNCSSLGGLDQMVAAGQGEALKALEKSDALTLFSMVRCKYRPVWVKLIGINIACAKRV